MCGQYKCSYKMAKVLATPKCPINPLPWDSVTNKSHKEQIDTHNLFSRNKKPLCLKNLPTTFFFRGPKLLKKLWYKGNNSLMCSKLSNFASRVEINMYLQESASTMIFSLPCLYRMTYGNVPMNSTHRACLLFNLCWPFKCFKNS